MSITNLFRPRGQIDGQGLRDGIGGKPRLFDAGFCKTYDAAYSAGMRIRDRERKAEVERGVAA